MSTAEVATEHPEGPFVKVELVTEPDAAVGSPITLRASRCRACRRVEFPALADCPADGGAIEIVALGPTAVLQGFTEVLHAPPGAEVDVPYTLAVAAFPENLAVLGRLESHVDSAALAIGAPLEVVMSTYRLGRTYAFRPVA